eukprot:scaffold6.g2524.t1
MSDESYSDEGGSSLWMDSAAGHVVAGLCAYTACVLCIFQIIQHLRHYSEPLFQRYIVRIIFMVPMYGLASFPSLVNTQNAIYYTTIRDCYEAWVIYNFMSLCLAYVGGPGAVETKMAGFVLLPSWSAWTCCLPPMPVNGQFVRATKRGALQFVILKPILAILTLVLYSTGHYEEGNWAPNNGAALYALLLFYLGTHELLAPFKPLLKFVLIKSVIFLTYWQSFFIGIGVGAGAVANPADATNIQNWLICIEGGSLRGGNVRHAISIRDVVTDTVHQFAPAYHDYVLYSDGADGLAAGGGAAGAKGGAHPKTVRTRTFVAVGQESSGRAEADASLIRNMELGGVSTWSKQREGPPAPGHTDDSERGAAGGAGPSFGTEEEGLGDSPPVLGKSKFLAQEAEDPFAEEEGGGSGGGAGRKKKKAKKVVQFDEIAL